MNKKLIIVFAILFLCIGLGGLVAWAVYVPPLSDHRAIVVDSSLSSVGDRCSDIATLVEIGLKKPPANGSTKLVVFLTGDKQTANEPRNLGAYGIPTRAKLTESNTVIASAKNEVSTQVKAKCNESPNSTGSSIFLALRRVVEALRSLGCNDRTACEILVQTDLQENAEPQIKKALLAKPGDKLVLPNSVNNDGIRIRICGISQTKGTTLDQKGRPMQFTRNRNTVGADRLQQVWSMLFTNADLVSLAPYCTE